MHTPNHENHDLRAHPFTLGSVGVLGETPLQQTPAKWQEHIIPAFAWVAIGGCVHSIHAIRTQSKKRHLSYIFVL
jgi:hypothetical protein